MVVARSKCSRMGVERRSSRSHIPSLKFVGLSVPKIRYGLFSVMAFSRLVTLAFDLLICDLVYPCYGLTSCQFSACYALPFSTYGQARDRQTDRQTDDGHQRLMPPLYEAGHNNAVKILIRNHLMTENLTQACVRILMAQDRLPRGRRFRRIRQVATALP